MAHHQSFEMDSPNAPILPNRNRRGSDAQQLIMKEVEESIKQKVSAVAVFMWSGWLGYTMYLVYTTRETTCETETPVGILSCVLLFLNLLSDLLALISSCSSDKVVLNRIKTILGLPILGVFVYGCFVVDSPSACDARVILNAKVLWYTSIVAFCAPIIFCVLTVCCLPCCIVCLPLLGACLSRNGTPQDVLNRLRRGTWSHGMPPSCGVCDKAFQLNEGIIKLPCDNTHVFHEKCGVGALRFTQDCPICARNVPDLVNGVVDTQSEAGCC
eukprot:GDKI01018778.1.p1 GENE.GDKI01018778.1~~GDKI01018778.1.p1  ORF type:complete len:271 (-),score=45.42 GDKI01018778.1:248-1060(-)